MNNDWKDRLGVVFSTNPDYQFQKSDEEEAVTLPNSQQSLHVYFTRAGRGGKTVTVIDGFVGKQADLKLLEKKLKARCGTGGSSKDGQVLIQGNQVEKIKALLLADGYKVKG